MRILIASPYLPWPLNTGGSAAQFSTLKCLEKDHQFTLVCPVFSEEEMAYSGELQAQLPLVTIRAVFCGSPVPAPPPKPNLIIRIARWCVGYGRRWLVPPALPIDSEPAETKSLYYPFHPLPQKYIGALKDELSKGVDLFQAEFAEMLPLGAWLPKQLPKLFIHHQIHFVYARRFIETHGKECYANYLEAVMLAQEQNYLGTFDGVVSFSDEDRQALEPYVSLARVFTSPFPIPADVGVADDVPAKLDGRFVFVGSEVHHPNHDALEWLLAEIWPKILGRLPSARLLVVGKWKEMTQANLSSPGLDFSGFVSDLPAILRGGIMLVPLRIASGIRVKIMVALAQGMPVVTTTVGCEGMPVMDGCELLVRDSPADFAAAAVEVSRNPELSLRLAMAGKETILKHYSPKEVRRRRNEIYYTVVRNARNCNETTKQSPIRNQVLLPIALQ